MMAETWTFPNPLQIFRVPTPGAATEDTEEYILLLYLSKYKYS